LPVVEHVVEVSGMIAARTVRAEALHVLFTAIDDRKG